MSPESQAQSAALKQGSGWRVGYRPARIFPALVGSDRWGAELTDSEWQAFVQGLNSLEQGMREAETHLMQGESITLEHTTDELTLTATGDPSCYQLFLQLHTGRRVEGGWDPESVLPLMQAVKALIRAG
ncbi:MAG: DUF1818 family protein [Synechococcaceae cyanobacterium RM1_1_27]|nr:DUF1818 family protein [Synechococcaceae cyanobacterium SM2_3_2]NJO86278.1 DUF1818 family protein [Synechococcaceae cyanobacterium RM1_1_27]